LKATNYLSVDCNNNNNNPKADICKEERRRKGTGTSVNGTLRRNY
jgi:hypothetical protein